MRTKSLARAKKTCIVYPVESFSTSEVQRRKKEDPILSMLKLNGCKRETEANHIMGSPN